MVTRRILALAAALLSAAGIAVAAVGAASPPRGAGVMISANRPTATSGNGDPGSTVVSRAAAAPSHLTLAMIVRHRPPPPGKWRPRLDLSPAAATRAEARALVIGRLTAVDDNQGVRACGAVALAVPGVRLLRAGTGRGNSG